MLSILSARAEGEGGLKDAHNWSVDEHYCGATSFSFPSGGLFATHKALLIIYEWNIELKDSSSSLARYPD